MIAQALNLTHAEIEEIRLAGLLHDIGKVGIPEAILNKSGPLDAAEWETMKTHTDSGRENSGAAQADEPHPGDGSPPPRVLRRHAAIPTASKATRFRYGARVIAIADAYDTITSARTYKKARTPEDAFAELERCAANQFDPEIVRVFIETMRRAPRLTIESGVSLPTPAPTTTF